MRKTLALIAISTLAATSFGCNAYQPAGLWAGTTGSKAIESHEVAMTAHMQISGPSGYRVLALKAWNTADIDHVTLTLFKRNGATYDAVGTPKSVPQGELAAPVTLNNLRIATDYKIVARAFSAASENAATEIDEIAQAGNDANCSITFTTPSVAASSGVDTIDDAARSLAIPVRLKNKDFAGQANAGSGVGVQNGTIVNTTATETF